MTAVAVTGTGRMGSAMAGRLGAAGYALTLWNRTRSRAEQSASGIRASRVADTPREAAEEADVVLVSLADDAAVTAAYTGDDGVRAGLRPGAVVLEMSTVRPDTVRGLAAELAGHVGARADQLGVNLDVAREAVGQGLGERDLSAIAVLLRGPDR